MSTSIKARALTCLERVFLHRADHRQARTDLCGTVDTQRLVQPVQQGHRLPGWRRHQHERGVCDLRVARKLRVSRGSCKGQSCECAARWPYETATCAASLHRAWGFYGGRNWNAHQSWRSRKALPPSLVGVYVVHSLGDSQRITVANGDGYELAKSTTSAALIAASVAAGSRSRIGSRRRTRTINPSAMSAVSPADPSTPSVAICRPARTASPPATSAMPTKVWNLRRS